MLQTTILRRLAVALSLAFFVIVAPRGADGAPAPVDIKIMSFNIKGDDGNIANRLSGNGWYTLFSESGGRRDRAISVVNTYAPDLLGVEEMKQNQLADLSAASALLGFGYYGQGRDGGDNGDRNGIFYRASRFTPLAEGDFWLSSTPTVPGTTFTGGGSDTGNPRMATWMKLYDNQADRAYFVLNTHWSLDTSARNSSANLIRDQINQLRGDLPLVVLGDFNTNLSSTALRTLTGASVPGGFQLADAYRKVFPSVGPNEATFHDFTGNQSGSSIDHILYSADVFTATAANIVHTSFSGKYPSDHFPVTATLQVVPLPEPPAYMLALFALASIVVARGTRVFARG